MFQDHHTKEKGVKSNKCQVYLSATLQGRVAEIRASDDSIEPEVLRGVGSVVYKAPAVHSLSTVVQTESLGSGEE